MKEEYVGAINKLSTMAAALATEIIRSFEGPFASIYSYPEPVVDASRDVSSENVHENTAPAVTPRRKVSKVPKKTEIVPFKRQMARANFKALRAATKTVRLESAIIEQQNMRFSKKMTEEQNKWLGLHIQKLRQSLKKQKRHFAGLIELNIEDVKVNSN